jgi:hypothetical protein
VSDPFLRSRDVGADGPDREEGDEMKRTILTGLAAVVLALTPAVAHAGVGGPAFYVNGVTYRTVGTPTDLSNTGAPASSFDTIYDFGGAQLNVATAAPGDPGYNGGRWRVHALSWNTDYATTLAAHDADHDGVLDTNAEVWGALADTGAGGATDLGVVKSFVCPVIRLAG